MTLRQVVDALAVDLEALPNVGQCHAAAVGTFETLQSMHTDTVLDPLPTSRHQNRLAQIRPRPLHSLHVIVLPSGSLNFPVSLHSGQAI